MRYLSDVNVWHSGTASETDKPRYLPGFRVFTAARLGDFDWRPQRTICDFEYNRFFPDEVMKEFFAFVWRKSTDDECHEAVCRLVRENAFSAALQVGFDDAAKASSKQMASDEQVQ